MAIQATVELKGFSDWLAWHHVATVKPGWQEYHDDFQVFGDVLIRAVVVHSELRPHELGDIKVKISDVNKCLYEMPASLIAEDPVVSARLAVMDSVLHSILEYVGRDSSDPGARAAEGLRRLGWKPPKNFDSQGLAAPIGVRDNHVRVSAVSEHPLPQFQISLVGLRKNPVS